MFDGFFNTTYAAGDRDAVELSGWRLPQQLRHAT